MADTSISFEFQITRDGEAVKDCDFCIDANYYIASHLKCEEQDLDDVLSRTSDKDIQEIAEWASDSCDHMYNILYECAGTMEEEYCEEEAKKLAKDGSDDYAEIYEEIMDELNFELKSVEIIVNGKSFKINK